VENAGLQKSLPIGSRVRLSPPVSGAHQKLRSATAAAHERVEQQARVVERLSDPEERAALMAAFYLLHAEVEAAAAPWLGDHPDLDFPARRRTPLLRRALEALGVEAPRVESALSAASPAEAIGLLYVVEGATLGGKIIRRSLAAGGCGPDSLDFLDPYGDATGAQWRTFLAVLEDVAEGDPDGAVSGALEGFRLAEQRLCGGAP
jgi:heme oxygenase